MSYIKNSLLALAISFLVACGGGGGGGTATPQLPGDAITITSANADGVAIAAVATYEMAAMYATGAEVATLPSMRNAINSLTEIAFNRDKEKPSTATGIEYTDPCPVSGTVTDSFSYTATSASGTLSFNSCNLGSNLIWNGSLSYSSTWNNTSGDYSDTANGALTMSIGGQNYTFTLNFAETGNDYTGDFSITVSFSLSGVPGGFLLTTEVPLTGNGFYPDSGQLLVQGGNGTRLRIVITSTFTADVYLDDGSGTFVLITSNLSI